MTCPEINRDSAEEMIIAMMDNFMIDNCVPAHKWIDTDTLVRIIHRGTELVVSQPMFVMMPLPTNGIYVAGSLDGDMHTLLAIFNRGGFPPNYHYIFLGDYLALEGEHRFDALLFLLLMKIRFPPYLFLLRGHHETYEMCKATRFDTFCGDERLFTAFMMLFDSMSIAARIDAILCVHSGISPFMSHIHHVAGLAQPTERKRLTIRERSLITDILYGMPDRDIAKPFAPSIKYPIGFRFNENAVLMVRGRMFTGCVIRGCGARTRTGVRADFGADIRCYALASGKSNRHRAQKRRILRLHPVDGSFILINAAEIFQQRTYNQFRAYARQEFSREPNFPHFLPSCLLCERELFGLKPSRITTSHRELAEYVRFKKVDLQFPLSNRDWLLDPRMVQYRRAELFPATNDEYWYLGMWSRITRLPYRPHSEEGYVIHLKLKGRQKIASGVFDIQNQSLVDFDKDDEEPMFANHIMLPGLLDESTDGTEEDGHHANVDSDIAIGSVSRRKLRLNRRRAYTIERDTEKGFRAEDFVVVGPRRRITPRAQPKMLRSSKMLPVRFGRHYYVEPEYFF